MLFVFLAHMVVLYLASLKDWRIKDKRAGTPCISSIWASLFLYFALSYVSAGYIQSDQILASIHSMQSSLSRQITFSVMRYVWPLPHH